MTVKGEMVREDLCTAEGQVCPLRMSRLRPRRRRRESYIHHTNVGIICLKCGAKICD